jgi:hypothetical protein
MESLEKKPFYKTGGFIVFAFWFLLFAVLIAVKVLFL